MALLDNKAIGERLKSFREELNANSERKILSVRQFATSIGIDQSQYGKIEKGELPITDNILSKIIEKFPQLTKEYILNGLGVNIPQNQLADTYSMQNAMVKLLDSNNKLVDSQRNFSESNKIFAESQKRLADTNAELVGMLKSEQHKTTVNESTQIHEVFVSKLDDLLEAIADAGSKGWKSKQEALAELSSRFYQKKEITDILSDAHR